LILKHKKGPKFIFMVIPPASTGRDSSNKTAVINIAQPNKGILCND